MFRLRKCIQTRLSRCSALLWRVEWEEICFLFSSIEHVNWKYDKIDDQIRKEEKNRLRFVSVIDCRMTLNHLLTEKCKPIKKNSFFYWTAWNFLLDLIKKRNNMHQQNFYWFGDANAIYLTFFSHSLGAVHLIDTDIFIFMASEVDRWYLVYKSKQVWVVFLTVWNRTFCSSFYAFSSFTLQIYGTTRSHSLEYQYCW